MSENPFEGSWTYRSFLNDPDVNKNFDDLEFGRGTIIIEQAPMQALNGRIGGPGWSLVLKGARTFVFHAHQVGWRLDRAAFDQMLVKAASSRVSALFQAKVVALVKQS